jgi:hypothetical protein
MSEGGRSEIAPPFFSWIEGNDLEVA